MQGGNFGFFSFFLSKLEPSKENELNGRRCPNSGKGKDFLTGQPDFFTETSVTLEQKVEKLVPRWEIHRHGEG